MSLILYNGFSFKNALSNKVTLPILQNTSVNLLYVYSL
uniref:Uncharacterized protein n=1 Tax=Rhizophora mucronata TaxID=61149 RepID=A0A2P2PHK1_RHIMU